MLINIRAEVQKMESILKTGTTIAFKKAVVRSANRAAVTLRKEAAQTVRARYNLPMSGRSKGGGGLVPPGIKDAMKIQKARYRARADVRDMVAMIRSLDKPISAIHFVKGPKEPLHTKGIPTKQRPKGVKVQVTRGNTRLWKGAFILQAKNAVQVFMHKGNVLAKQSVPSIYRILQKPEIQGKLRAIARQRFDGEMSRNLAFYMGQVPKS